MKRFKLKFYVYLVILILSFGLLGCSGLKTTVSKSSSDTTISKSFLSKSEQKSSSSDLSDSSDKEKTDIATSSEESSSSKETETPIPAKKQYKVTVKSVTGITINVKNGSEIVESGNQLEEETVLTLTYELADHYTFGYFTVNGSKLTGDTITVNSDIIISAVVNLNKYSVIIADTEGVTLTVINGFESVESGSQIDAGTKLVLTYILADHYTFGCFTVNGAEIEGDTVTINSDITISAVVNLTQYSVTIADVTGITITVKNGSETLESDSYVEEGTVLTLTYELAEHYTFEYFTINGTKIEEDTVTVNSDIIISAVVSAPTVGGSGTITAVQSTGGIIEADLKSATAGTEVTLSNTPQAGYVFSSYKVNGVSQTENTFTMPDRDVTVEAVFVKGIGSLNDFDFVKNYNYGTSTSGNVDISGNAVTNTQSGFPFVYSEALGDFYYETNVTFAQSDIKNDDQYSKCGIAINCGVEWMFVYIDATTYGGYGNNTLLVATNGRGTLGSGVDWYWANVQERIFNFETTYTEETTFKLGVLRIGAVYKFFVEDKFAYSLWLPEMNDAVNIGILSFNMAYRCTDTKLGNTTQAITNAKTYYGLTDNQNPTSISLDGYAGDWQENAVTTYGIQSGLKYFYASAFKGANAVYVVVKARTANYITTNSNWWQSTNVELRYGAGDSYQAYASANGQLLNVLNAVFIDKQEGTLHTVTVELRLPLSLWSETPTLGFAFRSEDVGKNMREGYDHEWWCGMTQINFQNFTVSATGLTITRETTPTENSIRTGLQVADPFILADNGMYYCYGGTSYCLYVWESTDLVTWKRKVGYLGYPNVVLYNNSGSYNPSNTFAVQDIWAPEVVYNPNTNKYVMFYSGSLTSGDDAYPKVGVATCDTPTGTFVDANGKPLLYPDEEVATIDASCFVDEDGQAYLYYCKDIHKNYIENYRNGKGYGVSQIWVVKLDETYTKTVGDPVMCIQPDQDWEFAEAGNSCWNEGPYVYKYKDFYYLTYSANPFWNSAYGVGLAVSRTPLSSFVKYANNPIVKTVPGVTAGTGHNMFFKDVDGKLWCAYHTFTTSDLDWDKNTNNKGREYPNRETMLSRAWFKDGMLKVEYTR